MRRDLETRLAALEATDKNTVVQQISDLIDELSDKAAGGDGRTQRSDLEQIFGGNDAY